MGYHFIPGQGGFSIRLYLCKINNVCSSWRQSYMASGGRADVYAYKANIVLHVDGRRHLVG